MKDDSALYLLTPSANMQFTAAYEETEQITKPSNVSMLPHVQQVSDP